MNQARLHQIHTRLEQIVKTVALVTAGMLLASALDNDWQLRPWKGVQQAAGVGLLLVIGVKGPTSRTGAWMVAAFVLVLISALLLGRT